MASFAGSNGSVAAVIPSWNSAATIAGTIAKLRESPRCKLIVVSDNASTDGTVGICESLGASVVASAANDGFSAAANRGIKSALAQFPGASFVLLINPDATIDAASLETLCAAMESSPAGGRLGAVAPKLLLPSGEAQPFSFGDAPTPCYMIRRFLRKRLLGRYMHDWDSDAASSPDWISAACILARSEAFLRESIFFDESYFLYFEDVDWCLRMRKAGYDLMRIPAARATHRVGASLKQNPAARSAYRRSQRRFLREHTRFARP